LRRARDRRAGAVLARAAWWTCRADPAIRRDPGDSLRRAELHLAHVVVVRERGRQPARVLPAAVLRARRRGRACAVSVLDAARARDRGGRARLALRGRRTDGGSNASAPLLLAQPAGHEHLLDVLPGDLALPRPEPLRAAGRARHRDPARLPLAQALTARGGRRIDRASLRRA